MPIYMHQLLDRVGLVYTYTSGEESLLEKLDPKMFISGRPYSAICTAGHIVSA